MSLLDELTVDRPSTSCGLTAAFAQLDPGLGEEFRQAIYDHGAPGPGFISASAISRALQRRGLAVSDQMIRRHRQNICGACRTGC